MSPDVHSRGPDGGILRGPPAGPGTGAGGRGSPTGLQSWPAERRQKAREGTQSMADSTVDLATVWDQIRDRLATSLSPQQNAMLNLTRPLGLVEDTAVLAAPNEFTQTVLESRMRMQLAEALSAEVGRAIRVPPGGAGLTKAAAPRGGGGGGVRRRPRGGGQLGGGAGGPFGPAVAAGRRARRPPLAAGRS